MRICSLDSQCQYAPVANSLDGVQEQVEEKLLELIRVDCNERRWVKERSTDGSPSLLELTAQQGKRVHDWLSDISDGRLLHRRDNQSA